MPSGSFDKPVSPRRTATTAGAPPPLPPSPPPPPPPPPLLPAVGSTIAAPSSTRPPVVNSKGPTGAFMEYWVPSHSDPDVGVEIHATGNVLEGFTLEIKRSHDFKTTQERPTKRIPLQWIDASHLDIEAMFNCGVFKLDYAPVCSFEASAFKVNAPGKSLNAAGNANSGKKIRQKDFQTWIVESANQLAKDSIFDYEVAAYLQEIES